MPQPHLITYKGVTRTLTEWANVLGVSHGVLQARLRLKWPLGKALSPGLFPTPQEINAAKTKCHRGHPFDAKNTQITKDGKRKCRECQRMWRRKWCAKRRS